MLGSGFVKQILKPSRLTHRTTQFHTSLIFGWVNRNPSFRLCAIRNTKSLLSRGKKHSRCWLNSPCNSSTALLNSSRTCNIPHHGVEPDRNQVTIIGVKLPAFQLSMNVFFRFHRNAPGSLELVWRDLPDRETRSSLPARISGTFFLPGFASTNPATQK
jgi:hypothetical protein